MPRDIPISNGQVLICFDNDYQIRDLYYPHVGQENHIIGYICRFGVWADGHFTWISDPSWTKSLKYITDTLITDVRLVNHSMGLEIKCNDFIDVYQNRYIRKLEIVNLWDKERDVRIFFHHDFRIYGNEVGDTGFYHPLWKSVIHYKKNRYFACGLSGGVEYYSIGAKALGEAEGTWKDAEDGQLQNTIITHGSVDSTVGKYISLEPKGSGSFHYWICMGRSLEEVERQHFNLQNISLDLLQRRTAKYWILWVNKENFNLSILPKWAQEMFNRSLLLTRTQIDHEGAILAANDSDVQFIYKDHYSYLWPRDGAMVAQALDQAHYEEITQKFYSLIGRIIDPQGFLLHKYDPQGNLASSWHPWIRGGEPQLPIQEDETALILWSLWEHFQVHRNIEFILSLYDTLILPAGTFLVQYRDKQTCLPLPSFDLWEERRGIMTFTCCAVEAGLRAAASFTHLFGDDDKYHEFIDASSEVKRATEFYLYDDELGRYLRGLIHPDDHSYDLVPDFTVDASLYGLFRFGTFDVTDPKVQNTMKVYRDKLQVRTPVGGMARYQYDWYHAVHPPTEDVPGNPWIISTLWLMIEEVMKAKSLDELEQSLTHLEWVKNHSFESGVLSEQVHPYTGQSISVSPLTWSHATVVECLMLYLEKYKSLT